MNQPRSRLATLASAALAGLLSLPAAAQDAAPSLLGVDGELPWYVGAGQASTTTPTSIGAGRDVGHLLEHHPVRRLRSADRPPTGPRPRRGGVEPLLSTRRSATTPPTTSRSASTGRPCTACRDRSTAVSGSTLANLVTSTPVPTETTNLGQTDWVSARAQWGGTSLFTLEGLATIRMSAIPTRALARGSRTAVPAA
jgi:hypothetical protein